jgi:hypothetical protein
MADANARLERLRRCNAARGHTEPIICCQCVSAEVEEEEDLESLYFSSGRMEPSLSFTTTATSRARSGIQLTPAQALAMAQEWLCYRRGGTLESLSSSPSPTKTRPWGILRVQECQIRRWGLVPRAPGTAKLLQPRR